MKTEQGVNVGLHPKNVYAKINNVNVYWDVHVQTNVRVKIFVYVTPVPAMIVTAVK